MSRGTQGASTGVAYAMPMLSGAQARPERTAQGMEEASRSDTRYYRLPSAPRQQQAVHHLLPIQTSLHPLPPAQRTPQNVRNSRSRSAMPYGPAATSSA